MQCHIGYQRYQGSNGRDLTEIFRLFPDISRVVSSPTRKDAVLDITLTNYTQYVERVMVNYALESGDGKKSDHKVLQIDSVLPRPRAFVWEVHQYLKTSKEGDKRLVELIQQHDWASVEALAPNNHDMALEFHRVLAELMGVCYTCLLYTSPSPRDS